MIEVRKVEGKRDLKRFVEYPISLYKGATQYVPQLTMEEMKLFDRQKNPFYQHAEMENFLAYKGGRIVGRVSAIINQQHNDTHRENIVFFGFLDMEDDKEVSKQLLKQVVAFGKAKGMNILRGPMNPSTNHTCGMLLEGYGRDPVIMMPYNFPYYHDHMKALGLEKVMDLYSYEFTKEKGIPEKIERVAKIVEQRNNFEFRLLEKKRLTEMLQDVKKVYNQAWEANWGFVPMTDAEIDDMAAALKQVLDPQLAFIVYKDDRPIGFSLSLPNMNQVIKSANGRLFPVGIFKILWNMNKVNGIRNLIMGVVPDFRKKGVEALMIKTTFDNGIKKGYVRADLGWILENNVMMNRELEKMGADLYKRFRIYEKAI